VEDIPAANRPSFEDKSKRWTRKPKFKSKDATPKFVSQLYEKVMRRKGHQKAIGAVGRHLAEATYWVLNRGEPYMDPQVSKKVREVGAQARS
jgi:hypothetical protein